LENGLMVCTECGVSIAHGSRYCPNCGKRVVAEGEAAPGKKLPITWETDISLLGNPLVMKQLALVVLGSGLIMALLLSFIFLTTGEFRDIPMMLLITLLMTGGFGLLLVLVMLVFFGNRTRVRFTVDEAGMIWETRDQRARTGNRLAVLAGILGRSPQTAGAGILAATREKEYAAWKDLASFENDPRHRMITVRNSWRPVMMLVCLPENYQGVMDAIQDRLPPYSRSAKPFRKPLSRALLRTALAALASTPLFTLSSWYYLDYDLFLPLLMFVFALATIWLIPLFGWVVIGCAGVVAVQLALIGINEFRYLYAHEQGLYMLAFAGLAFLAWYSWGALRGRFLPPLIED